MILDLPNRFLNVPIKQLKGYFNNLSKANGATRVFFATDNNEVYKKSLKCLNEEIFTDSIFYKEENKKIYVYEKKQENKEVIVKEEEIEYEKDLEFQDIPKGKIRILYKGIGEVPKMMVIDNTLRAKQKLVGGLIEVVQYDEDVVLVCNEEGKLLNMQPNLVFDYDYIAGNCFVIGDDYKRGDFRSLSFEEIEKYTKELENRSFKYLENKEYSLEEKQKEKSIWKET